jgi:hypothetical protein
LTTRPRDITRLDTAIGEGVMDRGKDSRDFVDGRFASGQPHPPHGPSE